MCDSDSNPDSEFFGLDSDSDSELESRNLDSDSRKKRMDSDLYPDSRFLVPITPLLILNFAASWGFLWPAGFESRFGFKAV